ncbi:MAG: DUF554 domain-containing protein [Clostridia bacterium]|nr:DUF554 domain-containing protein [Clostridia bacterium]
MIGMGTIINCAFVLAGGLLGFLFGKALKQRYQDIMIAACGLSTIFIGAGGTFKQMLTITDGALGTQGEMMLVISMCLGGLLGEILNIEARIEQFGEWLKVRSHSERDARFVEGFMSASFTLCIGAMAIIGPMNDALYGDYTLLVTKGILDMIIVMALSSSMGKGAVFSVIPLALWQGLMTVVAAFIGPMMTPWALSNLSLVGNVLIFGVGVNLVFGKKIRVANYLPALVVAVLFAVFGIQI